MSYKTDIPRALEKIDWQKLFTFIHVKSMDQFRQVFKEWEALGKPIIALDTETTHLSIIDLKLVGFSFCFDKKNAYYVPVGHVVGENLPFWECLDILSEMITAAEKVLFFNASFDLRVLRKYGLDISNVKLLDVMALIWNVDTNIKMPSLKKSALYHLGFKMITFNELMGKIKTGCFTLTGSSEDDKHENISFLSPEHVVDYGSADALCTYFLFLRWEKFYKENQFIIDLDSEFERTLMFLEETPLNIDLNHIEALEQRGEKLVNEIQKKINDVLGESVDLNSSKQLGEVFERKKLPVRKNTSTENYNLDEGMLGILKEQNPGLKVTETCSFSELVDLILMSRKIRKEKNTYLKNFKEHSFKKGGKAFGFFQYLTHLNPTGRLQGTGEKPAIGNSRVFFGIQSQNITKPKPAHFKPVKKEGGILGWDFIPSNVIDGETVEGFKLGNLREVVIPYPDHYIFSADFSGQEMVIAANLSNDRAFIDPLKRGEDPHKDVAIRMFGKENYDSAKRKIAKYANFGCLYLGGWRALKDNLSHKSETELKAYVKLWRDVHVDYFNHLDKMNSFARINGYVKSKFGRYRRVAHWFNSPDDMEVYFGKKTVANSPVQGCGGDIIRYVLTRIFQEVLLNSRYDGKVYFISTVHDEVNFSITKDPDYFYEISQKILSLMVDLPFTDWEVPLKASPSVGRSWGELYPFRIENGVWVPDVK